MSNIKRPGDIEKSGAVASISVLDGKSNQWQEFDLLIDTLSSAFWIISDHCQSVPCRFHVTLPKPLKEYGKALIELNIGYIKGSISTTHISLANLTVFNQPLLLVNEITAEGFDV